MSFANFVSTQFNRKVKQFVNDKFLLILIGSLVLLRGLNLVSLRFVNIRSSLLYAKYYSYPTEENLVAPVSINPKK